MDTATANVLLLHVTRSLTLNRPVQVGFSVTNNEGVEEMQFANIPTPHEFYKVCLERGWIKTIAPRIRSGTRKIGRKNKGKVQAIAQSA